MKILHVTKKYPNAMGGDAVVVSNLQKQQEIAGHQVAILTSNCDEIQDGPNIFKFGLKDTPSQLDLITIRRLISLVFLFFSAFKTIGETRPDIIHTHSIDMAFIISFAARFYKVPVVHTFHIVTFYDENQSAIRRKTEIWLAQKSSLRHVTAPNMYDVKKLQQARLKQAVQLPNGVDLAFWQAKPPTKKSSTFIFLSVGRLEEQKGYAYLVQAAAHLARSTDTPFLVKIVGEGSQLAPLLELADRLNIATKILFVGRKQPDEVRQLLAEAGAAVLPSLYETTPLTLLEAWAASVPVIATPVGLLRDTPPTFHGAQQVPLKDDRQLAEAMSQLMHDSALRKTLAAAGTREVKKYSWKSVAQIAETIYGNAL